ncbi:MAG: hypothetical protein AB6733_14335 [Clostridiaceae bacterium]
MKLKTKRRMILFIKTFLLMFIVGFLTEYFLKDKNIHYDTIISVALGMAIGITFFNKNSIEKLNEYK